MRRLMMILAVSAAACGGGHIVEGAGDLSASADLPILDLAPGDLAPGDLDAGDADAGDLGPPPPLVCMTPTLDVSQSAQGTDIFFNGGDTVDQAFVVGRTGSLAAVSVGICPRVSPAKYGAGALSFSLSKGAEVLATSMVALSTLTTCTPRFDFDCVPVTAGETLQLHVTATLAKNVCTSSFCPLLNTTCSGDSTCGLLYLEAGNASPPLTLNGMVPMNAGALVHATYVQ